MATAPSVVNDDTQNTYLKFRGNGSIFRRAGAKTYTIRWYDDGVRREESTGSRDFMQAKRLLAMRQGSVARGEQPEPKMGTLRFDEAIDAVLKDYQVMGKRSLGHAERRYRLHLSPYFGRKKMKAISADTIRAYQVHRQDEGAANATINREIALVRRAFTLAQADRLVNWIPDMELLPESEPRQGIIEPHQFDKIIENLPEPLRGPVRLTYFCGWRIESEVWSLEWHQVDRKRKVIRLDAKHSKNGEARDLPYEQLDDVIEVIETQWQAHQQLAEGGTICPWVFHRDGRPIKSMRRAWKTACKRAGCPDKIPHDLRRTASTNLIAAGVPEVVAMKISGHKTRSTFRRYMIANNDDVVNALGKVSDLKRVHKWVQSPKLSEIEQFEDRPKMAVNS